VKRERDRARSRSPFPHHVSRITFHASRPPLTSSPPSPPAVSIPPAGWDPFFKTPMIKSRASRSIVPLDFHFCPGERVFHIVPDGLAFRAEKCGVFELNAAVSFATKPISQAVRTFELGCRLRHGVGHIHVCDPAFWALSRNFNPSAGIPDLHQQRSQRSIGCGKSEARETARVRCLRASCCAARSA